MPVPFWLQFKPSETVMIMLEALFDAEVFWARVPALNAKRMELTRVRECMTGLSCTADVELEINRLDGEMVVSVETEKVLSWFM